MAKTTEPSTISLPVGLSEQAKALGINISFVTARGINDIITKEMWKCRKCRWLDVCIDPCCEGECPKAETGCNFEQGDLGCQKIVGKTCKKFEIRKLLVDPEVEAIKKMLS